MNNAQNEDTTYVTVMNNGYAIIRSRYNESMGKVHNNATRSGRGGAGIERVPGIIMIYRGMSLDKSG